jgi:hypothetical protein
MVICIYLMYSRVKLELESAEAVECGGDEVGKGGRTV